MDIYYTPEFKRNLRSLAKINTNYKNEIKPYIAKLCTQKYIGKPIPGSGYSLYKVEFNNEKRHNDIIQQYNLIYHLRDFNQITLITLYTKTNNSHAKSS